MAQQYNKPISGQCFEIILNGLRSRIILDTCKFIHIDKREKLSMANIKDDKELLDLVKKSGYSDINDYVNKLKAYRDKEISHCDYEHLYEDKNHENIIFPPLDISKLIFQKVTDEIGNLRMGDCDQNYLIPFPCKDTDCLNKRITDEVSSWFENTSPII